MYPTLADVCGLTPPTGLEGKTFRPLLDDPSRTGKLAAYTKVMCGQGERRSVRTDRWRYTEWDGGKKGAELYDHADDPGEYHNLAGDPSREDTVAELKALLKAGRPATELQGTRTPR